MMANDEFMEKYDEAIKEIGEIRNKKKTGICQDQRRRKSGVQ